MGDERDRLLLADLASRVMALEAGASQAEEAEEAAVGDGGFERIPGILGGEGGFPWGALWPFGITLSGSTVHVYAGILDLPHVTGSPFTTSAQDVTLGGAADAWVYVKHARDHSSTTVSASVLNSRPGHTSSFYQFPLYKFTLSGAVWSLSGVEFGGRDILGWNPI